MTVESLGNAMLLSTDRILVRHVGSLRCSALLTDLVIRGEGGETIDQAVNRTVRRRAISSSFPATCGNRLRGFPIPRGR